MQALSNFFDAVRGMMEERIDYVMEIEANCR